MKVKKHYEQDHVILYVTEGDLRTTITLESDRQMKRLADCLTDLFRTDSREVSIGEIPPDLIEQMKRDYPTWRHQMLGGECPSDWPSLDKEQETE